MRDEVVATSKDAIEHWQANTKAFSIKQIYLLREMCWIPLPIGDDLPDPDLVKDFPRFSGYGAKGRRGRLGFALQRTIEEFVEHKNSMSCDDDPWLPRPESRKEGYAGFHLLWDHGKLALKSYALGRSWASMVDLSQEEAEYERKHLWAESSDEEGGI